MKRATSIAFFAGLALLIAILASQGVGDVLRAAADVGLGLFPVITLHLLPLILDSVAWARLLPKNRRPRLVTMLRLRWIGESINGLLPVARIGGEWAKARLLARAGVPDPLAAASVIVAMTSAVLAQMLFVVLAAGLLALRVGGATIAASALLGAGLLGAALGLFCVAQNRGLFGAMLRLSRRLAPRLTASRAHWDASALDADIRTLYQRKGPFLQSTLWHLAAWLTGSGEIWLTLHFMGRGITPLDALTYEGLIVGVRAAGFVVPGALGLQEGGFLVLGSILGVTAPAALGAAVVRRCRELTLGLPGLATWWLALSRPTPTITPTITPTTTSTPIPAHNPAARALSHNLPA